MKLFGGRKAPEQTTGATLECTHPLTHRIALREDPSSPARVTGHKCTRCGQMVTPSGLLPPEQN